MKNKEELQELLTLYKTVMEAWKLRSQLRVSVKRKINLSELLEMVEDEIDGLLGVDTKDEITFAQKPLENIERYVLMRNLANKEVSMVLDDHVDFLKGKGWEVVKT